MKSDATKIYELYAENAAANEQPKMKVNKYGTKRWFLHDVLHREDGPAIEYDGGKEWWLHDVRHANVNAWAKAVLKMRNKPHDAEAVQKFVRTILTKDDLL